MKTRNMLKFFSLVLTVLISHGSTVYAQSNWRHTEDDREVAVEVDTLERKGFSLIWINKDKDFDAALKQRLIDVYFVNYPKLSKKFNKNTLKQVTFVIDPDYKGIAATGGGIVRYNPDWFVKNPNDIDIVTHEVMHIVQAYPSGSGPGWLVEGIADYIRDKYGIDNAAANWSLPDLKEEHHYTNSYRIAAGFLKWVERYRKKGIVKTLDAALRNNTYTDKIWVDNTKMTLDELWDVYIKENL